MKQSLRNLFELSAIPYIEGKTYGDTFYYIVPRSMPKAIEYALNEAGYLFNLQRSGRLKDDEEMYGFVYDASSTTLRTEAEMFDYIESMYIVGVIINADKFGKFQEDCRLYLGMGSGEDS